MSSPVPAPARPATIARRCAVPALALLVAALLTGCSSTGDNPRPDKSVLNEEAPTWVYDPSAGWDAEEEPFTYYATGQAPIHANLNLAEESAKADALADVQSFLETTIQRLNENWAGESGDLLDESALSSMVNDEMFTREVISGTLNGARIVGKWYDSRNYYIHVKYNAEDSFLGTYVKGFSKKLAEHTREMTTAERDRMRSELERVVKDMNGD